MGQRVRVGSQVKEPEATQMALTPLPHRNQQLFSDHYLDVTLPERSDWKALATEAQPVFLALQELFTRYTPSEKEAQLEEDFVKPVLRLLGHTFEVQPSLETPDGTKTPDYVFYRDQASLISNKKQKLTDTLLEGRAFAVGDAKYWDRPLDVSLKRTGGDPFTNKNPSYQIAFYMQHSGLGWGILTNGRLWRLYHKDTAHKLDRFYEVNLPELLQGDNVLDFLYFYAFFRKQAFVESGDLSIEAIRLASVNYARGVGDSLKAQVYEALRHVAQGFLDYQRNNLQPEQTTLKLIYDNSLILLYRLLFILYTETRGLLPVYENQGYGKNYSLDSIKRGIQTNLTFRLPRLSNTASLWGQLQSLFVIIQEGSPALDVSTFNGSLFNPERHPFLEQYKIGDYHLQLAIDKLARVDGQFVDYRDLSERHIGTIYEGLLEFHLEPLAAPVDGWTIDLKNEKGERKATGSYYTPDYVVKYMVEETLEPVLLQAIEDATTEEEKIQAILNIKVLDPAMGSGHFPVEATEYIARFLIEHVHAQTDTGGETELAYWRRRVVQSCIYGVDLNPLAVDLAQLSLWLSTVAKGHPLSFLDHHLRWGNSLVGARLAELSADTAGAKKNGRKMRASQVNGHIAQPMLFDADSLRQELTDAVDLMRQITMSPAQTASEVKKQEHVYRALRQRLTEKYSSLANVVSATHFGLSIDQAFWKSLADYATNRIPIGTPQFDAWLTSAQAACDTYHFFHWELEFPEVFFGEGGEHKGEAAGFHAVIGNPPYVRQEELGPFKTHFATTKELAINRP